MVETLIIVAYVIVAATFAWLVARNMIHDLGQFSPLTEMDWTLVGLLSFVCFFGAFILIPLAATAWIIGQVLRVLTD